VMGNALALLIGLVFLPAQAPSSLALTNVRLTYGILGPVRTSDRFLPGDNVVLSFDIEGATLDSDGKVKYAIGWEVLDKTGKSRFHQLPKDMEISARPGASLPACVKAHVGFHLPPGAYTIKVTVSDRSANAEQQLTREVEVLPKDFGIVRLALTRDEEANQALVAFSAGRPSWVNFALVGFARDQGQGSPDVGVELQVTDESGNPAFKEPKRGSVAAGVPRQAEDIPMQFELKLVRPGKYKLELKATDKIGGKQSVVEIPLQVQAST
jgi:hypothetical protein